MAASSASFFFCAASASLACVSRAFAAWLSKSSLAFVSPAISASFDFSRRRLAFCVHAFGFCESSETACSASFSPSVAHCWALS